MKNATDTHPGAGPWTTLLLLALAACTTQPAPQHPRQTLALPEEVAARYCIDCDVAVESLERSWQDRHMTAFRGVLVAGDERAEFQLRVPAAAARAPFVVLLPILAGGNGLMDYLGDSLAGRGYAAGWCKRVASALVAPQRGAELEVLFRRTVLHNRMLLRWARRSSLVDGDTACLFGISMGGMIGSVLMAVEPDLQAGAICLAGADLGDIVRNTTEPRVLRWLAWRREEDGAGRWEIGEELRAHMVSDPARLSAFVETDKVLLVAATLDNVIPRRNQDLLWEALGRPRRMLLPLGHYTAVLALNPILDAVTAFFDGKLLSRAALATDSGG